MSSTEVRFKDLINSFLDHRLSAPQFESSYLKLWREVRDTNEYCLINDKVDGLYSHIMTTLDCYCADPKLREASDLNEEQLYTEVEDLVNQQRANR